MAQRVVGSTRRQAWGEPDLSANPYLSLWEQTSRLYAEAPIVIAPVGAEVIKPAVESAGLWSLMQRVQRDVLGLREMGVRVEIIEGRPVYTPIFPDLIEAAANPRDPGQPCRLTETRWDSTTAQWVRVTWDAEKPSYSAATVNGEDVSMSVLGGRFDGDAYPYRVRGVPVVPVVLYHAAETARLWDAWTGQEIVEGSLRLGVFLSFFGHSLYTSSWAQRWAVGVDVSGAGTDSGDGAQAARREVITDPATLLLLAAQDGAQPMIGQWDPPISPDVLMRAIGMYEERLVESAGLRLDVTRQSSDIRSGYSLAVARDAIREAQAVYAPLFARSDSRLLALTAALMGVEAEGEWTVIHRGLPESPAERRAAIDEVTTLRAGKLLSRLGAFRRLNPDLSESEAKAALAEIDAEGQPAIGE